MAAAAHRRLAIGILLFATFMDLLDVTIVQVALPAIAADLQAPDMAVEWVVSGYLLAFAVALVTGGRLGDIFGRKRMFLLGVAGFTLASGLCAGAWTIEVLISARVLQGLLAAAMVPQLLATLQSLFPPRERAPWYGLIGATTGLAAVAGPLLGGVLVDADLWGLSWRTIFLINLPVGIAIVILAAAFVPETRSRHPLRVDLRGVLLLSAGLLCLMVPLVEGRTLEWPAWLLLPVATGIGLLFGFIAHCRRRQAFDSSAVLPLRLFRNRGFTAGVIAQSVFQASLNAFTLPFVFYLQLALGHSALSAGLSLLAFSLGSMVATAAAVPLVPKLGRHLVTVGAALMGTGFLWTFLIVSAEGLSLTPWSAALPMALAGVGLSAVVIPLVDVALATVPIDDAGAASGVLTTFQQLGAAVGVAISMTVFFTVVDGDWSSANALAALRSSVALALIGLAIVAATSFTLPGARAARDRRQSAELTADHAADPPPNQSSAHSRSH